MTSWRMQRPCREDKTERKRDRERGNRSRHSTSPSSANPSACSIRPLTREDFYCRPGFIDAAIRLAPLEFEIATAQMIDDSPLGSARENTCHANGASPGSAGQGLTTSALPSPLPDLRW